MGSSINITSKYYIRKQNGGYNPCIPGNTQYMKPLCNGSVVPNCVGYATGRFNERLDLNECKYLGNTNANNFINAFAKSQGLEVSQTPKEGACMVWTNSGAGHVAIVEKVESDTSVITSESGWSYTYAYYSASVRRQKGNGNWGINGYTFLGFLLPPSQSKPTPTPTYKVGDWVKVVNPITYNGQPFFCYYDTYTVMELNGDRAVIGKNGVITAAINTCNIEPVNAPKPVDTKIKVGDTVKVRNAVLYGTNKPFYCYYDTYTVMELNGDRAVIGKNGVITAAVNVNNLEKV